MVRKSQFKSINSEYQLFREIKGFEIESKVERSLYNRRKRKLFPFIEEIRMKMVDKLNAFESYFVIDSMPLEVCKITRSTRSKICKDVDYAVPNKGFCASKKLHFMVIKCMLFVRLPEFLKVLICHQPRFMTSIIHKILNCNCQIVCYLDIKDVCLKPSNLIYSIM